MKKIDIGQTLGIIANIGVVVGIVFLAFEISQNTRSLEVSAYQNLTSQITSINALSVENPRAWLLANGTIPLNQLEPEDQQRAINLIIMVHIVITFDFMGTFFTISIDE